MVVPDVILRDAGESSPFVLYLSLLHCRMDA